jgi:hypothetical protein
MNITITIILDMKLKLKLIYDRQSVGQSILVSGANLGPVTNFSFAMKFFCRQLRLCYYVASSLTRGRVCNLLLNCFWALPEQSLLSRSPAELTAIFYCLIWDSPNLEGQVPVFISPINRVAQLYPRALGSLSVASYDSRGLRWRYSNPPPHGVILDIIYRPVFYLKLNSTLYGCPYLTGNTLSLRF